MPVVPAALAALIQTNVNANLLALNGVAPLSQKNPSFFIEMCLAIATGIGTGTPVIDFTSSDTGMMGVPPIPGAGTGIGIVVDNAFFEENLYTAIRSAIISQYGKTTHDSYPPGAKNSGQNLLALCKGIADAVKTNFTTSWTLTSVDPTIYAGSGTISDGDFSGIVPSSVQSLMIAAAPNFQGSFWPTLCQCIADSYAMTIEQHSTGSVTIIGVCVPSLVQVCGIPSVGTGIGTAV